METARPALLTLVAAAWLAGLLCALGWARGEYQGWIALAAFGLATGLAARSARSEKDTDRHPVILVLVMLAAFAAGAANHTAIPAGSPAPAGLARIDAEVLAVSYRADGTA